MPPPLIRPEPKPAILILAKIQRNRHLLSCAKIGDSPPPRVDHGFQLTLLPLWLFFNGYCALSDLGILQCLPNHSAVAWVREADAVHLPGHRAAPAAARLAGAPMPRVKGLGLVSD